MALGWMKPFVKSLSSKSTPCLLYSASLRSGDSSWEAPIDTGEAGPGTRDGGSDWGGHQWDVVCMMGSRKPILHRVRIQGGWAPGREMGGVTGEVTSGMYTV